MISESSPADPGKVVGYSSPDGKQYSLSNNSPYILLMVLAENDSIAIRDIAFKNYKSLPLERKIAPALTRYSILPAKYYQGKRYFPLRIYPLKVSNGTIEAPQEVSITFGTPPKSQILQNRSFAKKADIFESNTDWWIFSVDKNRVFEISKNDAANWGVNAENPEDIHLFSFNGAMLPFRTNTAYPEQMSELPVFISNFSAADGWQEGEKIYVYVRGADFFQYDSLKNSFSFHHHFYATENYLWLAVDPSVNAPQVKISAGDNSALTTNHAQGWKHFEKDEVNRLKSGTTWFENARNVGNNPSIISTTIDNDLICYDCANPQLNIRLALAGGNRYLYDDRVGFSQYFDVDFEDDGALNRLVSSFYTSDNAFATISTFYPLNNVLINPAIHLNYHPIARATDGSASIEQGKYFFDYYELNYPLSLTALRIQDPFFYTYESSAIKFDFSAIEAPAYIWNVTNANQPRVSLLQNDGTVVPAYSPGKTNSFVLLTSANGEKLSSPQQISYSFHLRDPAVKADMIIISPQDFYEKSVEYGETREAWEVGDFYAEVVLLEDIYREFSGGVKDPGAIRNYLKYCWDNRNYKPSYALLMGDGNFDPKGIIFDGNNRDFIPTFQIDAATETGSFTTDFYYADLNITTNSYTGIEPEIPLGRLPVSSNTEIDHYIEKLQNYGQLDKSNGWEEDFLLIADDLTAGTSTNETFHFEGAENIYANIPNRFNVFKLYLQQYPAVSGGIGRIKPGATQEFLNRVNQGQAIVLYIGHGAPDKWAHETLYDLKLHRNQISNNFTNGLWMALSCDISKFDDPGRETMGEDLILRKNSGAMWVFASARLVLAYQNNELGIIIVRWLLGQSQKYSVGEALTLAVQDYSVSNSLKYILFGDPSLPMLDGRIPITFDNPNLLDTLKSLQKVNITGSIGDAGHLYPDFNGNAVLRVYDTEDTLTHPNRLGGLTDYDVLGPGLYKGQLSVENGSFSARFIVPKSIKYSPTAKGKIWFYAADQETGEIASVAKEDVVFYGSSGNSSDFNGPDISISIDQLNTGVEGDVVQQNSHLVVQLVDSSGINVSGEAGHEIALWVDNMEKLDLTDFFVYQENSAVSGQLDYPLNSLKAGSHDFVLKAWDNANNPNEYHFNIEIVEAGEIVLKNVVNFPNPMTKETWFTCQTSATTGRIEILVYTLSGRKIKTLRQGIEHLDFQRVYWDGRDENGNELANGSYLYRFKLITPEVTKTVLEKLVILN